MKRLLVVANPFPPMASAGNHRLLRFIRHLPEFGWEATVLTARAQGPEPVPDGVRVERTVAPNPESLYGLARRLHPSSPVGRDRPRTGAGESAAGQVATAPGAGDEESSRRAVVNRWLLIPDQYAGWIVPAVVRGRALLEREAFDVIMSSCPRPSTHVVASSLARMTRVPWVADYRDPWTTNQFRRYPTAAHRHAHERLERWVLACVDRVVAVNQPIADELEGRHPRLLGRVHVIPNGYDLDETGDAVELGEGRWIVNTGRLYGRDEQVRRFLTAFAELPQDVHVLFLGGDAGRIMSYAADLRVDARVCVEPFAPHARALGAQRAADALLLLTGRKPESLSSKVYEYLASGKPIFAVTPPDSAARALLDVAGGAACASADEPLAGPLAAFVEAVSDGRLPPPDEDVVARYDAVALTSRLARLLDSVTVTEPPVAPQENV